MKHTLIQIFTIVLIFNVICSCGNNKSSDIFTVDVDYKNESKLSLSEISENVEPIELEMTDESLISSRLITRVLYDNNYVIIVEIKKVMLFNHSGKFIRQIGSIGQGPGEFINIGDVAADFDNKQIFIYVGNKIICYNFEGKLQKEITEGVSDSFQNNLVYVNYQLLFLYENQINNHGERVNITNLLFYDKNLGLVDSLKIKEVKSDLFGIYCQNDYIVKNQGDIYFYIAELSTNNVLGELYKIKEKQLISECQLKFRHDIIENKKNIYVLRIYRSRRYIFSYYQCAEDKQYYNFCYDTKTNKSYNLKGGYYDDYYIHENVDIRPFKDTSEMFYYLHTNMSDDDKDEPNPTLYIGTLKK